MIDPFSTIIRRVVRFFSFSLIALLSNEIQGRPNVVLIMADDLGYHDLSCYGHPSIKTPVLDKLSKEGIRLTSFYAGATVCTPSRMALLTGAYPSRLGWKKGVIGHLMKEGSGLHPNAVTMGEIFSDHGYRTGIVGKWHLGEATEFLPQAQGFDECLYITRSNNQTDTLWKLDAVQEQPFTNSLLTEKFTNEAIRFIKNHNERPFFLYLPYSAPHFPLEAHPDWKGNSAYGVYGDVVEEMDHRIGNILATLKDEGLEENTIVVFLSDNGPEPMTKESKAIPYRGRKWDALEGGTRVPCIIKSLGHLSQNTESDALISAIDLLPTLCEAAGIELKSIKRNASVKIDGVSVWSALTSNGTIPSPRNELLFWHGTGGFQAIREDQWKLYLNGNHARISGRRANSSPVLFDLATDPGEKTDVSGKHPERVQSMEQLARTKLEDIRGNPLPLGE
ncbi:MAG: arylsulfatase A [Verrucomicrobiales bacterium]|jgi:arylsulfatase A